MQQLIQFILTNFTFSFTILLPPYLQGFFLHRNAVIFHIDQVFPN